MVKLTWLISTTESGMVKQVNIQKHYECYDTIMHKQQNNNVSLH